MAAMIDRDMLAKWEARLGLLPTNTRRVRRSQITSGKRRLHMTGYCPSDNTIYYSCKVDEWALVHELLHKLHPNLHHNIVKRLTDETLELFRFHDESLARLQIT